MFPSLLRALAAALFLAASLAPSPAVACTSILVSKGASADGATMLTYAADSHELYGDLRLAPALHSPAGALREVIEWDTGKRLGAIPQARRTFAVVGNMNERQVVIGETTFTGREELRDPTGTIDYGTLMQLGLERAATAREAIAVMTDLVSRHGYASTGETFSISDPKEAWLLEMIGKGPGVRGAVWVARRVPDGMITAHANCARIRRFPLRDPDTLYAKDVIELARAKGYFKGKDEDFSFADAYAPLGAENLRFAEARVWRVLSRAAPSLKLPIEMVKGSAGAERLPLWVKPDQKLAVADMMALMRDHFEGTELDLSQGVGAGPYQLPYRWRPLTWEVGGKKYVNERSISTQQTGFSFIAQSRAALPDPIGGLTWFGVDDTFSTVWVPIYAGSLRAPPSYAVGRADLKHFSWESAFWVFNWVANWAYSRYSEIVPDVQAAQRELEGSFLARQASVEQAALERHRRSPEEAREYLTEYSVEQAERTVRRWRALGEELLVKYMDGNLKDESGKVQHPGYPKPWYELIARLDGQRLELKKLPAEPKGEKPLAVRGFFHSRDELGALGTAVPKDFDFQAEKLVLVPGSDACERPPRCCAQPVPDGDRLIVDPSKDEAKDPCGTRAWLLRLPRGEKRTLVRPAEGH